MFPWLILASRPRGLTAYSYGNNSKIKPTPGADGWCRAARAKPCGQKWNGSVMCFPSALGDAALAPANAPTPDPGGQPGLRGGGGGFVALSGAVRLASKWTAVSAGRSGFDPLRS